MAKHLFVTNAVACEYHEPYNPASCPSKDLAVITGKVLNGPTQKLWARRRWELDAVSKPELEAATSTYEAPGATEKLSWYLYKRPRCGRRIWRCQWGGVHGEYQGHDVTPASAECTTGQTQEAAQAPPHGGEPEEGWAATASRCAQGVAEPGADESPTAER